MKNGGLPPQPTLRHIFGGIALAIILVLAFLNIHIIFKYVGAALTFIPSRLGLFQVVSRSEVMPVDFHTNPTAVTFSKPGRYLLYTDDQDLLMVNDAIIASKGKPWINLHSESGEPVQVHLIDRGMAIYDTPWASGRPVVSFEILQAGVYTIAHPSKPIDIYFVPDYVSGREGRITFYVCLEIVIVGLAIWFFLFIRRTEKNRPIRPPERPIS
jgi:hypothetical protein